MSFENLAGRELPGDEIEFIGRARPKPSIKTPIGEVRSFLPNTSEKSKFEEPVRFTGHDSFMNYVRKFDGDLDEVEIDFTDDDD